MSFAVSTQQTDGYHKIILQDNIALTHVEILPVHGARLHAFFIQTNDGLFNIIDNYPNADVMQKELTSSFKGCKLSPFACRIPGGRYVHDDKVNQLQNIFADGSAIHGLLYNKPFVVVDEFNDDKRASVLLKFNYNKDDKGFPFEYRCEVLYSLMPHNLLQVQTTILNVSDTDIPLADGWHPYFTLGENIDDCVLQFNASSMLEFNEKLVPTGKLLPYSMFIKERSLQGVSLDNCFLLNEVVDGAACTLYNPRNKLSVNFFPGETYPYLQIYIPPGRQSIAIENLSGAPDCFNNKIGLILLPPGQSKTFTIHYKANKE